MDFSSDASAASRNRVELIDDPRYIYIHTRIRI